MSKSSYTIHGGSWYDYQALSRAACRDRLHPDNLGYYVGFRIMEEVEESDTTRVARGGSWLNHAANARAAVRPNIHPDNRGYYAGFRIVEGL